MSEDSMSANVLLALPEATLRTQSTPTTGTVYLQYLSFALPSGSAASATSERSAYLIVRLNDIEFPIDPNRPIARNITPDGTHVYTFILDDYAAHSLGLKGDTIPISLSLRSLPEPARIDAIETFDQILGQYAGWEGASGGVQQSTGVNLHEGGDKPEDLRGRLVLMDETTGEMVGEVPHQLPIHEDPALVQVDEAEAGMGTAHAAPVVLELPPDVYDAYTGQQTAEGTAAAELSEAREIFVRAVPPEQQDWITKSASLLSRGINSSTSLLVNGMSSASQYYIKHSAPYSPPSGGKSTGVSAPPSRMMTLLTHPTTHTALGYAHTASGHATRISSKTVELVEGMIRRAVGGRQTALPSAPRQPASPAPLVSAAGTSSTLAPSPQYGTYPMSSSEKPPLPPRRDGSKSPAPPLPPRSPNKSPVPAAQPPSNSTLTGTDGGAPPAPLRTRDRLLLSANLVLASVDESVSRLLDAGTMQLGAAVGHRYGPDAARSTGLAAGTARNVVLVYVDVRGFARKALIKRAGREFVKGRAAARGKAAY
ncbi:hypothetical protein DAEQUDRAFT_807844 [Daedalea quercina L-15889]|uniref:Senescence domain-containing protein n=1 Tax=Daedalea quercina L-15889 TaxID=1314783 RepID=A0A165TYZ7_9APHY|nr:hypothetical protein DAEQUDRAFT_807844 [Daedalea quercina L-15889]